MFAETRPLAQEWTFRFLGAALEHHRDDEVATLFEASLPPAGDLVAPAPTTAEVRAWARLNGLAVPVGGRLGPDVWVAYREAHDGIPLD